MKIVKKSLSEYWYHTGMGDVFMRRRMSLVWPVPVRKVDKTTFARDFELAVMQRGRNAKNA